MHITKCCVPTAIGIQASATCLPAALAYKQWWLACQQRWHTSNDGLLASNAGIQAMTACLPAALAYKQGQLTNYSICWVHAYIGYDVLKLNTSPVDPNHSFLLHSVYCLAKTAQYSAIITCRCAGVDWSFTMYCDFHSMHVIYMIFAFPDWQLQHYCSKWCENKTFSGINQKRSRCMVLTSSVVCPQDART